MADKSRGGRPRSERSRKAILATALALLEENQGTGLSIEAIARRAGVGKPTIYRWWPSLADIVLEALLHKADTDIPVPRYESLEHSLGLFLGQSLQALQQGSGPQLRFLMARAQEDDSFRERFRERFVSARRAVLLSILQEAARHGDIGTGIDPELLVDMLFGAMWYRLLTGHAPLDDAFARDLVHAVMRLA